MNLLGPRTLFWRRASVCCAVCHCRRRGRSGLALALPGLRHAGPGAGRRRTGRGRAGDLASRLCPCNYSTWRTTSTWPATSGPETWWRPVGAASALTELAHFRGLSSVYGLGALLPRRDWCGIKSTGSGPEYAAQALKQAEGVSMFVEMQADASLADLSWRAGPAMPTHGVQALRLTQAGSHSATGSCVSSCSRGWLQAALEHPGRRVRWRHAFWASPPAARPSPPCPRSPSPPTGDSHPGGAGGATRRGGHDAVGPTSRHAAFQIHPGRAHPSLSWWTKQPGFLA